MISPVSVSKSMSKMHGRVESPGILVMFPQMGTMNPAPADSVMSLMTSLKPVGAPLIAASPVNELAVLPMQIGSLSYPCK